MPRQPRLDAPGLLQHVMARGIERRDIFKDDKDRKAFLDRRKNPLIPEAPAMESFSAGRRIAFSQFRPGIEKEKKSLPR